MAVEARDFVRRCIESCQGHRSWQTLCRARRVRLQQSGEWTPEREDFTWLETAFSDEFLKHLRWFGGLDYEWRTGARIEQGGFWVLLWSKDPRRLWWELRDELERQAAACDSLHARAVAPAAAKASARAPRDAPGPALPARPRAEQGGLTLGG